MIRRLASAALGFYRREPARCNTAAAAALSWLLLKVGLEVDDNTVLLASTSLLALAAGELTRRLVVPTATVDRVISDEVRAVETYAEGGAVVGKTPIVGEDRWEPVSQHVRKPKA